MPTTSLGIENSKPAIGIETDVGRLRLRRELVHAFARRQGIGAAFTVTVTVAVVGVLWAQIPTVVLLLWAGARSFSD
jgi:hypothetical protein